jgi:hypothetical protein
MNIKHGASGLGIHKEQADFPIMPSLVWFLQRKAKKRAKLDVPRWLPIIFSGDDCFSWCVYMVCAILFSCLTASSLPPMSNVGSKPKLPTSGPPRSARSACAALVAFAKTAALVRVEKTIPVGFFPAISRSNVFLSMCPTP